MPQRQKVFESIGDLEEVSNGLARASRHPLYADLGTEYGESQSLYDDRKKRIESDFEELQHTVVWNNRDDEISYIGSDRYNLIQHREVIDTIRDVVNSTAGTIAKGVIRDYGSKVDGVIVFGEQNEAIVNVEDLVDGYVPPEGSDWINDRLGLGLRFRNSFDGGARLSGSTMAYRFICGNWLVWGEETIAANDVLHLRRDDEDVGVDPEFFEDLVYEVFDERSYVEDVIVDSTHEEVPAAWAHGIYENAGFGRNYIVNAMDNLRRWNVEEETDLWTLYNAMTTYIDNDRVHAIRNGSYDKWQRRSWNILTDEPRAEEEVPLYD